MNGDDVRIWEFWNAVRDRLNSLRMGQLLRGADRVYKALEQPFDGEDVESEVWGRVVVLSTDTLWPTAEYVPGETQKVSFQIRAEVHAPTTERNFEPARLLEAVHAEAHALLQGWAPFPFQHAMVALPIYRVDNPSPMPFWDEARGLWFTSAEYRTEFAPAPGA